MSDIHENEPVTTTYRLTDEQLDAPIRLASCGWNGNPNHCLYLNNHRISGGKPWGGGVTTKEWKGVTLREIARAIPALQAALDQLSRNACQLDPTIEQSSTVRAKTTP